MKKILKKVLIMLLIILPFISICTIKADSGWDSSYGGGSHRSSSSHSHGTYGTGSSYSDDDVGVIDIIVFLVFMFLFGILPIILYNKETKKKKNYVDISEDKLKAILPNLTLEYLKDVTYDRFVDIQRAWMNFDYNRLRDLCTDELYNTYTAQLDTLKLKNGQNVMGSFKLEQIKIIDIKEEDGKVSISVYMKVTFKDYVINKKTKEVIRGDKNSFMTNNYIMTFVRGKDAIDKDISCPNCGAPIKDTASSKCDYCGADIVKDSSEFVLSKKTNINY